MDLVKISSKHQITIGKETFLEAGFEEGEVLAMRSTGLGRVEIWSVRAVLREKAGRLTGAADAHARMVATAWLSSALPVEAQRNQ